ncbi:hypothetical protein KY284_032883 [Solanum tuberosum]|nr:hypothetical protein KY284_032883 [Solanum tuberosum]
MERPRQCLKAGERGLRWGAGGLGDASMKGGLLSVLAIFMDQDFWCQHSKNHATYEQQGAHEFIISMLDRIHDKEGKARHHLGMLLR